MFPDTWGTDDLAPAQAELELMFPTAEQYHAGTDPARNARFDRGRFRRHRPVPLCQRRVVPLRPLSRRSSISPRRFSVRRHPPVRGAIWAKYTGATDYDQQLHCDFRNHMLVVPSDDPSLAEVEMFIYIHGVPEELGPTDASHTATPRDLPMLAAADHPRGAPRDLRPGRSAPPVRPEPCWPIGPARTTGGPPMTASGGARFSLKASYRTMSDIWFDKMSLTERLGESWYRFVQRATPRQLELVGFPPAAIATGRRAPGRPCVIDTLRPTYRPSGPVVDRGCTPGGDTVPIPHHASSTAGQRSDRSGRRDGPTGNGPIRGAHAPDHGRRPGSTINGGPGNPVDLLYDRF